MSGLSKDTGLPDLPEGYRWRVEDEDRDQIFYIERVLRVAVVYDAPKPRRFSGKPHPTKTEERIAASRISLWARYAESANPAKFIRELAYGAMEDFNKFLLRTTRKEELNALLGDYPPKRLEP